MSAGFTVEMTATPVLNDDWDVFYKVLDSFPGTVLIQDAGEPMLIFWFDTEQASTAQLAATEAARLAGISYTRISVTEATPVDFDYAEEEYVETV